MLNNGHAPLTSTTLHFHQPLPQIILVANDTLFDLAVGASCSYHCSATFGNNLPAATELPFFATLSNDRGFAMTKTLPLSLGAPTFEDFETGNFANFNWQQNEYPWEITSENVYAGNYCAKSKTGLGNNQSSTMSIAWNSPVADVISFYYKVSSENNDYFYFIIDGEPKFMAYGNIASDWTLASYPVSAGNHTFTFTYIKDWMMSSGSDCAWIDNVHFPAAPVTPHEILYRSDSVCQGHNYVYKDETINTSVSGSFSYGGMLPSGDIEVLELEVLPTMMSCEQAVSCDEFSWRGRILNQSGLYVDTLSASSTCDSIVSLTLTINQSVSTEWQLDTMAENIVWNGEVYSESGTYSQWFSTLQGCDSLVTLYLTLTPPDTGTFIHNYEDFVCRIYPNPTRDVIHIDWQNDKVVDRIDVYNLQGKLCATATLSNSIDIKNLSSGMYFLYIYTDERLKPLQPVKVLKW